MNTYYPSLHYSKLAPRQTVQLFPTHIHRMLTGCAQIQQNRVGLVTLHYENGATDRIPMADFNLWGCDDFLLAFKTAWKRKETGA